MPVREWAITPDADWGFARKLNKRGLTELVPGRKVNERIANFFDENPEAGLYKILDAMGCSQCTSEKMLMFHGSNEKHLEAWTNIGKGTKHILCNGRNEAQQPTHRFYTAQAVKRATEHNYHGLFIVVSIDPECTAWELTSRRYADNNFKFGTAEKPLSGIDVYNNNDNEVNILSTGPESDKCACSVVPLFIFKEKGRLERAKSDGF